jgi:alpha-N-arabinofuranosidase
MKNSGKNIFKLVLSDLTVLFVVIVALIGYAFSMQEKKSSGFTASAKNPIANPSFEDVEGNRPKGWQTVNWQPKAEFAVDESVAHSGKRSIRISSVDGADSSFQSIVAVQPYAKYRLSGWIKTRDLKPGTSKGALINLHAVDIMTKAVSGTQDWTRVEVVFDTAGTDAVSVNCLFGGWGKATGTAWYDDVQLELLSARTLKPEAAIDTTKSMAPISKYIYGQFIEHLGRCIYQGIWAEMLEDRKFYYPVGGKESAWKIIGEPRNVRMNPILPYVGVHVPEIRLKGTGEAGGIYQDNLAVIKGKSYVGRVVLAADPGALPIHVSLARGPDAGERLTISLSELGNDYRSVPLSFKAEGTSENARLEIISKGNEAFRVGTVSIMPADNIEGFRPEVLKILKELDAPVYRWPGGNFVSGYDWKDGLGDPDRRPPRKNPAWLGIEHNDVGIHEFLDFCRLIGTDPYISVNSGQGSETLAAEEVEYVNGAADTAMGKWRARNGHPQPWGVKFWSIGNEMYGNWQLGHMPLQDYTKKHNRFAQAMRAKDPTIKLIAVGAVGTWSEGMLAESSDAMDYISEHFYCGELPGLLSHISQIPREVRQIAQAHRKYRTTIPTLRGKDIRIALDEWNYWYGDHLYGELGTRYFWKDGLGIAEGLHEYFRQSDIIYMANYAQTVNVIGAIKTTKTAAEFETTGLVLKLYRAHYGTIPVLVSGATEPLDVAAAWKEGKKVLTVAVVNPTKTAQTLPLSFKGISVPKSAKLYLITGGNETVYNEPGKEPAVKIQETSNAPFGSKLTLPPLSISLYEVQVGK